MTAYNDVTGDALRSGASNEAYRNNYDAIFGKKEKVVEAQPEPKVEAEKQK